MTLHTQTLKVLEFCSLARVVALNDDVTAQEKRGLVDLANEIERETIAAINHAPLATHDQEPWTEGEPKECDGSAWDRLPPLVRAEIDGTLACLRHTHDRLIEYPEFETLRLTLNNECRKLKAAIAATQDQLDVDVEQLFNMTCDEQFKLATQLASNVGYVLVPEPSIQEAEDKQPWPWPDMLAPKMTQDQPAPSEGEWRAERERCLAVAQHEKDLQDHLFHYARNGAAKDRRAAASRATSRIIKAIRALPPPPGSAEVTNDFRDWAKKTYRAAVDRVNQTTDADTDRAELERACKPKSNWLQSADGKETIRERRSEDDAEQFNALELATQDYERAVNARRTPSHAEGEGLVDRAEDCALYNFDGCEMVECKHELFKEMIVALRGTPAPAVK